MSKRRIAPLFLLLGFAAAPLWSQPAEAPRKSIRPDFDARDLVVSDPAPDGQRTQDRALVERRRTNIESILAGEAAANPGTRIVPNRFGLPKVFFRDGKPLSGPSTGEPEDIAKAFLQANSSLFPFTPTEISNLRLVVKDVTGGGIFLAFNQTLGGIDVFEGQIKFALSRAGEVVQTAAGEVNPVVSVGVTPRLSAEEAVRAAFEAVGVEAPRTLSRLADSEGKTRFLNPRGERFNPIGVELSIFPLTASTASLAYRILLDADATGYFEVLIGAGDGVLLYRRNLWVHAAQGTVWTQSPLAGSRQSVSFPPASNPFPDAWLPATPNGATGEGWKTTGNNTDAYLDATGDDQPDPGTVNSLENGRALAASADFTFPFGDGTTGLDPRKYQAAAVANLFYFVNVAHDYFYGLGFTEAAGNFQSDNFGRGGAGNDPVNAEAQYSGFANNADFSPTPEGTPPYLRTSLFTHATPSLTDDRDSAYDGSGLRV